MKRILAIMTALALIVPAALRAQETAAGDAAAPTFNAKAAATQLTPEQEEKAQENLDEAVTIYKTILRYDEEGQIDTAKRNLDYIDARLAKAVQERQSKLKEMEALKAGTVRRYQAIQVMPVSDALKDDKMRELKNVYDTQREFLMWDVERLGDQITRLESRRAVLRTEIDGLEVDAAGRPRQRNPDDLEDWQAVDEERTKVAVEAFDDLVEDAMDARARKYQDD